MKKFIITLVVIAVAVVGIYLLIDNFPSPDAPNDQGTATSQPTTDPNASVTPTQDGNPGETVIGSSVEGRSIVAHHYGNGSSEILFVGGIHGGYEWNTVLVAYELMDYLQENSDAIPSNVKVSVIPVLNPDGLNKTVGITGIFTRANVPTSQDLQIAGRFNAHTVDLNRNFDCDWKADGTWQNKTVSGGTSAFSEPESQAIKQYVESRNPAAVVVWYSAAGGVFASSCHNGVSAKTSEITKVYADASGYPAYNDFDFYAITGDMVNWLAKKNIPAISVLLTNHTDTEWSMNRKGIDALLKHYAN